MHQLIKIVILSYSINGLKKLYCMDKVIAWINFRDIPIFYKWSDNLLKSNIQNQEMK